MNQDELLALIGEIYDAASDLTRWPRVLERIADAFAAEEASLSAVGPTAVPWLVAPRTDPAYLQSYGAYYHPLNLFWRGMSRLPIGAVATDTMVLPKEELRASEFYNDWSRPQGYLAVMGATLLVEDGWRTEFVMPGKHEFGPEHLKLYAALAPHLQRAIQLNRRLARAEVDRAGAAAALDQLTQGALLVDAQARVLFANRAAEAIFAGGGLRLIGSVLRTDRAAETAALRAAIASCASAGLADGGGCVHVSRDGGRPPLSLLVIALRSELPVMAHQRPIAIVFVTDPVRESEQRAAALQQRYGLTPAEAAFALEIIKGDGKQAAAERRGISFTTARTHLSNIFDKTGTHRQAELVRLLLDGGPD